MFYQKNFKRNLKVSNNGVIILNGKDKAKILINKNIQCAFKKL